MAAPIAGEIRYTRVWTEGFLRRKCAFLDGRSLCIFEDENSVLIVVSGRCTDDEMFALIGAILLLQFPAGVDVQPVWVPSTTAFEVVDTAFRLNGVVGVRGLAIEEGGHEHQSRPGA
jgi:hypothetical protein